MSRSVSEGGGAPLTKALQGIIETIILLSSCASRAGELVMKLLDGPLELRNFDV